jgi:GcrA cell cycle regulator
MTTWTEDRIATLRRLWDGGRSASEIALALGGVTRNAVIGKVHRLGIGRRTISTPYGIRKRAKTALVRQPGDGKTLANMARNIAVRRRSIQPEPDAVDPLNITILDRRADQCAYATVTDPARDHRFCGHPVEQGSYCAAHAVKCYTPAAMRARRERSADDYLRDREMRRYQTRVWG